MNILLADDSLVVRKSIVRCLNEIGEFTIEHASDGQEAVDLFKTRPFGLVITDWHMPNKSGVELVAEIRELDDQVPILMVTCEAQREHVIEALTSGASDYLIKPFTHKTLREKLAKHGCVTASSGKGTPRLFRSFNQ